MLRTFGFLLLGAIACQATPARDDAAYLALNDVMDLGLEYLQDKIHDVVTDSELPLPGFSFTWNQWLPFSLWVNGSVGPFTSLQRTDDTKLFRDDGDLVLEVSLGLPRLKTQYQYYAKWTAIDTATFGWVNATLGSNSVRARAYYTSKGSHCKLSVRSLELVDFGPVTIESNLKSCPFLSQVVPWSWIEDQLRDVIQEAIEVELTQVLENPMLHWLCGFLGALEPLRV